MSSTSLALNSGVNCRRFAITIRPPTGPTPPLCTCPVFGAHYKLFLSTAPTGGTLIPLGTFTTDATIPPGEFITRSLPFFPPSSTGTYYVVAETDVNAAIVEASTANNTTVAAQPLQVLPAYTANVSSKVSVAVAGTPIPLAGTATLTSTNGPAAFDLVNIHIFVGGTERIISALTDANGNFSATFMPLPGEAGQYTIGATNPGVAQANIQGSFTIIGMSATPPSETASVIPGTPAIAGQVTLTNLSNVPLSNLTTTVVGAPGNLNVSVTLGNGSANQGLAGAGTLALNYRVTATDTSVSTGTFTIHVATTEGATVDIPVQFSVISLTPKLIANPGTLQAGMIPANQTVVQFTLTNSGGAASGPLQIVLPSNYSFLSLSTPASIPSLAPGASTQVTLLLSPTPTLPLATYSGNIIVQGPAGNTTIPFSFVNLATATGELQITTVDEFTYYAAGSPNLAGAGVTVTNALTNQVAATGTTDSNGLFDLPSLQEGYYQIHISADQHTSYDATVFVNPGVLNPVTAFLSRQVVKYTFTVLPTSIQDQTQVEVSSIFETNVPDPVITLDPPTLDVGDLTQVGQVKQVNVTITNHGLVAAQNMMFDIGTHPYYSITALIRNIGTLPADSSITIPFILRRIAVPDSVSPMDTTPGAVADPSILMTGGAGRLRHIG